MTNDSEVVACHPSSGPDGGVPAWPEWNSDQRAAMVLLVQDTLDDVRRDVDDWLPDHIRLDGDSVSLTIRWMVGTIDAAVIELRSAAVRREQERIADLQRMVTDG